jgi:hypothetical protein
MEKLEALQKFDKVLLLSALVSLVSGSFELVLLKLLFQPIPMSLHSKWPSFFFHILSTSYLPLIPEQTCLGLSIFDLPSTSFKNEFFFIMISWLFFSGFLSSDPTSIIPLLFILSLRHLLQSVHSEKLNLDKEIKKSSDENKTFREKLEAYRRFSSPYHSASTSKRTSHLISKLKSIHPRVKSARTFTESSDVESNSSDNEVDGRARLVPNLGLVSGLRNSFLNSSPEHPGITNDDIKEIINTLISQEYLMWNPEKSKAHEVDLIALAKDAKKIYTQSIENLPGSSRSVIKIPKLKLKRIQSIRSMIEVSEKLSEALEMIGEWDFNCFSLIQVTKDPAFEVGLYVFTILGLSDRFQIDTSILRNFMTAVETAYNRLNYYHNSIHAADVTASTVFLIQKGLSRCGNLIDLDVFALIVSAICHDIGHPGVNNAFLVATSDDLALKYNDASCLENMHTNKAFTIINSESCNITKNLSKADYQRFRKNMVSAILATDLQVHFDKLNEFRTNLEKKLDISDDKFRIMAIQMCLKCADIGHGARKLEIHKEWTSLITKEFFRQGELEAQHGIPVSPLCDRNACVLSKSQVGFLEVLVKPLFKVWEEFVEQNNEDDSELEVKICIQNILENIEFWDNEFHNLQQGLPIFTLDNRPPPLSN